MRTLPVEQRGRLARHWLRTLGLGLLAALAIVACGGGSDLAGVGSGGTGSFSVGTITGFGSVFVNGQRYDDVNASVSDEDGPRNRADLRLGMVVTVQGSVGTSGSATASSIVFDSELLGPVDVGSINPTSRTFAILGQTVVVAAGTVFDAQLPLGLSSIRAGQPLEVYGFVNPIANTLQAGFIAPSNAPGKYKIGGTVSSLQNGARTFRIGSATVSYAGLDGAGLAQGLADGVFVKVRLTTGAPDTAGARQATGLRLSKPIVADQPSAEIEGLITSFTSPAQFSVGTIPVDARNASFPDGTAGLVQGARVEVKGAVAAGTLLARQVKLKDPKAESEIELKGSVSAADNAAKTFVVRGVTVNYAGAVQYQKGSQADLRDGAKVQVKGQVAPNSAIVNASEIEFED